MGEWTWTEYSLTYVTDHMDRVVAQMSHEHKVVSPVGIPITFTHDHPHDAPHGHPEHEEALTELGGYELAEPLNRE